MCTGICIYIYQIFDYVYLNYVTLNFQAIRRIKNSFPPNHTKTKKYNMLSFILLLNLMHTVLIFTLLYMKLQKLSEELVVYLLQGEWRREVCKYDGYKEIKDNLSLGIKYDFKI